MADKDEHQNWAASNSTSNSRNTSRICVAIQIQLPGKKAKFYLKEGISKIGSDVDNDIILNDENVSFHQALINVKEGIAEIRSLASGTTVNEVILEYGIWQHLFEGDVIGFNNLKGVYLGSTDSFGLNLSYRLSVRVLKHDGNDKEVAQFFLGPYQNEYDSPLIYRLFSKIVEERNAAHTDKKVTGRMQSSERNESVSTSQNKISEMPDSNRSIFGGDALNTVDLHVYCSDSDSDLECTQVLGENLKEKSVESSLKESNKQISDNTPSKNPSSEDYIPTLIPLSANEDSNLSNQNFPSSQPLFDDLIPNQSNSQLKSALKQHDSMYVSLPPVDMFFEKSINNPDEMNFKGQSTSKRKCSQMTKQINRAGFCEDVPKSHSITKSFTIKVTNNSCSSSAQSPKASSSSACDGSEDFVSKSVVIETPNESQLIDSFINSQIIDSKDKILEKFFCKFNADALEKLADVESCSLKTNANPEGPSELSEFEKAKAFLLNTHTYVADDSGKYTIMLNYGTGGQISTSNVESHITERNALINEPEKPLCKISQFGTLNCETVSSSSNTSVHSDLKTSVNVSENNFSESVMSNNDCTNLPPTQLDRHGSAFSNMVVDYLSAPTGEPCSLKFDYEICIDKNPACDLPPTQPASLVHLKKPSSLMPNEDLYQCDNIKIFQSCDLPLTQQAQSLPIIPASGLSSKHVLNAENCVLPDLPPTQVTSFEGNKSVPEKYCDNQKSVIFHGVNTDAINSSVCVIESSENEGESSFTSHAHSKLVDKELCKSKKKRNMEVFTTSQEVQRSSYPSTSHMYNENSSSSSYFLRSCSSEQSINKNEVKTVEKKYKSALPDTQIRRSTRKRCPESVCSIVPKTKKARQRETSVAVNSTVKRLALDSESNRMLRICSEENSQRVPYSLRSTVGETLINKNVPIESKTEPSVSYAHNERVISPGIDQKSLEKEKIPKTKKARYTKSPVSNQYTVKQPASDIESSLGRQICISSDMNPRKVSYSLRSCKEEPLINEKIVPTEIKNETSVSYVHNEGIPAPETIQKLIKTEKIDHEERSVYDSSLKIIHAKETPNSSYSLRAFRFRSGKLQTVVNHSNIVTPSCSTSFASFSKKDVNKSEPSQNKKSHQTFVNTPKKSSEKPLQNFGIQNRSLPEQSLQSYQKSAVSKVANHEFTTAGLPRSSHLLKTEKNIYVMFTGEGNEDVTEIVTNLGGIIVEDVNLCTHLIANEVRRTIKFLCCIAKGVPIVSKRWLLKCKQANSFVDHSKFILHDVAAESRYAFTLKKTLTSAKKKPLLSNWNIFVTKHVHPSAQHLKSIIESAGGKFLQTMPTRRTENVIVISANEDTQDCRNAVCHGFPVLEVEFILTGLLQYKMDFVKYQLTVE